MLNELCLLEQRITYRICLNNLKKITDMDLHLRIIIIIIKNKHFIRNQTEHYGLWNSLYLKNYK